MKDTACRDHSRWHALQRHLAAVRLPREASTLPGCPSGPRGAAAPVTWLARASGGRRPAAATTG